MHDLVALDENITIICSGAAVVGVQDVERYSLTDRIVDGNTFVREHDQTFNFCRFIRGGEGIGVGFEKAMDDVSEDMQKVIATDFNLDSDVNVNGGAGGGYGMLGGFLISIQQMIVRSEDDIRKISQELYNLMQTGSRAQGRFITT